MVNHNNNMAEDINLRSKAHAINIVTSGIILMGFVYCLVRANRNNRSSVYDGRYRNVSEVAVPRSLYGSSVPVHSQFSQNNTPSAPPVATMLHNNQQSQTGYAPTIASLPV